MWKPLIPFAAGAWLTWYGFVHAYSKEDKAFIVIGVALMAVLTPLVAWLSRDIKKS